MNNENNKNKNIFIKTQIILAILLAIFGLITGMFYIFSSITEKNSPDTSVNNSSSLIIDSSATTDDENTTTAVNPLKDRQIFFAGFDDVTINEASTMQLVNLEDNKDIYIKYEIIDTATNEIIHTTDLIPSGEYVKWNIGETLGTGEYDIAFHQRPYWRASESDEWTELSNGETKIHVINVKDN